MSSCARAEIIRPQEVSVYHWWNRCVRRAFFCGQDRASGIDYEDRRDWIHDMEGQHLAGLFAIEIGFRGEMSNHRHLVLRTRPDVAGTWSDEDVARRSNWTRDPDALFWGHLSNLGHPGARKHKSSKPLRFPRKVECQQFRRGFNGRYCSP